MKGVLAILLPSLMTFYLVSAQANFSFVNNGVPYADHDSCQQVGSLSDTCKREFREAVLGPDPAASSKPFCTGNCSSAVLEAYQSCDAELADPIALLIAEGE